MFCPQRESLSPGRPKKRVEVTSNTIASRAGGRVGDGRARRGDGRDPAVVEAAAEAAADVEDAERRRVGEERRVRVERGARGLDRRDERLRRPRAGADVKRDARDRDAPIAGRAEQIRDLAAEGAVLGPERQPRRRVVAPEPQQARDADAGELLELVRAVERRPRHAGAVEERDVARALARVREDDRRGRRAAREREPRLRLGPTSDERSRSPRRVKDRRSGVSRATRARRDAQSKPQPRAASARTRPASGKHLTA